MKLLVLFEQKAISLDVAPDTSFDTLLQLIAIETGVAPAEANIVLKGRRVLDGGRGTMSSLGFADQDMVAVTRRAPAPQQPAALQTPAAQPAGGNVFAGLAAGLGNACAGWRRNRRSISDAIAAIPVSSCPSSYSVASAGRLCALKRAWSGETWRDVIGSDSIYSTRGPRPDRWVPASRCSSGKA